MAHPIAHAVALVDEALTCARVADPGLLSEDEQRDVLLRLSQQVDQLESLRLRVIGVVGAAGGVAESDGARSAASWLTARMRTGFGPARAAERLAEAITDRWQRVGAGLEDGSVNLPQARVIVRALESLVVDPLPGEEVPVEVLAAAEAHLVAQAAVFDPGQLERLGAKILEVVAPATCEEHERRLLERAERRANAATRLTFRRRGDGATDVAARIPDHVAARLKTYLEAWTAPRQDDSTRCGAATPFGGFAQRDPATGVRLPQERLRGQAFCAFLEAADPGRMPVHGGGATRVVVTMTLEELRSGAGVGTVLSNGEEVTTMSAGQVRRLACQAGIIPAVLGSDSVPMDLGRSSRFFTPGQRLAKSLTHLVCAAEGCSVPSTWCDGHHGRDPWGAGGGSDLADLTFLCPWHHQRAHDNGYTTKTLPNGDVRFTRRT
ncbi:HNH endonuclease signature motif containing protein [Nocardioides campestrisoli]|uniref:HNH endonuclease signature motif containing protein n=1 Tax=Nocardioides campestrisoli TaxID=2736757 RepID=UPI0015E762EF|nr:HNH endonuclease signature motif containing protein [Nocardioides campestrisoli]